MVSKQCVEFDLNKKEVIEMKEEIKKQAIIKLNKGKKSMKVWTPCKKSFLIAILILSLLGLSNGVEAQKYPTRPITLLMNSRPGAGVDMGSRLIATEAMKILGQEIIPVNKPGGGGSLAAIEVVNSKADGYTLLGATDPQLITLPQLESVGYDLKDFSPIIATGVANVGIVVRSDSPFKSFKDFIDFARKNPGKVSYGDSQFGTSPHLAMEHVAMEEKLNIAFIHFMGAPPNMTALLGGHISACGVGTGSFFSHYKAGKVRVLAALGEKRMEAVPDAPTLVELGYPYGGAFKAVYLISAPKGTPSDVVKTLDGAFRKAMEMPEYITYVKSNHLYLENPLSGQSLKEDLEARYLKIGEVIRKANLTGKK